MCLQGGISPRCLKGSLSGDRRWRFRAQTSNHRLRGPGRFPGPRSLFRQSQSWRCDPSGPRRFPLADYVKRRMKGLLRPAHQRATRSAPSSATGTRAGGYRATASSSAPCPRSGTTTPSRTAGAAADGLPHTYPREARRHPGGPVPPHRTHLGALGRRTTACRPCPGSRRSPRRGSRCWPRCRGRACREAGGGVGRRRR